MKKLRWTMDGQGFWELDVSTPTTLDGAASPVPRGLLPLGLSRGSRLSRANQIHFMQRFMAAPFVPSYSPSHGFALQRVFTLPFPFADSGSATFLGQFNLQKFMSSFKRPGLGVSHRSASSFLQAIGRHLCHRSLYALGISSEISLTPDDSLLISFDGYGHNEMLRTKALLHHKFLHHDLTMEALSPGLFLDESGNYWDVPSSLVIDLGSAAFDSGPSYHLSMHHNAGSPSQSGSENTGAVPLSLLPGLSLKAAFSFKHNFEIWRSNAKKLKMVQPYDIFLSNPHVSLSGIIGAVATTYFGDNSAVRSAAQDSLQGFRGLNMQTSKIRSTVLADVFASISFSAQYGMFQRAFLDLTRFSARMDFHSGSKFILGAMLLIEDLSNSRQPRTETVKATLPNARFSLQQQIAGPFSFRADSGVAIDLNKPGWGMQVEDPTFALEYALQVLGSAKAIAWYSPNHREFMVELRFYEN